MESIGALAFPSLQNEWHIKTIFDKDRQHIRSCCLIHERFFFHRQWRSEMDAARQIVSIANTFLDRILLNLCLLKRGPQTSWLGRRTQEMVEVLVNNCTKKKNEGTSPPRMVLAVH
jgi:hypothetical protein